ncbi:MAG: hypothetical protein IIY55_01755 [Blautia sp.]|nr:hypothetical protein [Blautia sp.]
MEQNDRMKDTKNAMNARLLLLMAGLFLLVNAITTTGRNGLSWIGLAQMVEESAAQMEEEAAGVKSGSAATETTAAAAEPEGKTEEALDAAASEGEAAESAAVSEASEVRENNAEAEDAAAADAAEKDGDTAAAEPAEETEDTAGAAEAAEGTADAAAQTDAAAQQEIDMHALMENMKEMGITVADLRRIGIVGVITAVAEIIVGLLCALFANRVDRAKITLSAVSCLMVVEIAQVLFLLLKRALSIASIIGALLLPGALLWAAVKMYKLHKAYPERVYALNPRGGSNNRPAAPPAPQKSLKERAMMDTHADSENDS